MLSLPSCSGSIPTADLMKKGLRLVLCRLTPKRIPIPTADLMKKGLRPSGHVSMPRPCYSNRRPDEEGIKTSGGPLVWVTATIPTADLMKKGLRLENPKRAHRSAPFQPQT